MTPVGRMSFRGSRQATEESLRRHRRWLLIKSQLPPSDMHNGHGSLGIELERAEAAAHMVECRACAAASAQMNWQGAMRKPGFGGSTAQGQSDGIDQQAVLNRMDARLERFQGVCCENGDLFLQDDGPIIDPFIRDIMNHHAGA